jgi:hypothetical protein
MLQKAGHNPINDLLFHHAPIKEEALGGLFGQD